VQLVVGTKSKAIQPPIEPVPAVLSFKKTDAEMQVVWGEVFAPGIPDSQGDVMDVDDIREMMFRFMKADRLKKIDVRHSTAESGAAVVECFQARDGDPDFIPGSWVLGVWCPSEVWAEVKKGDLNGFSLDGMGIRVDTTIELEMPEQLVGETSETDGHLHAFVVKYDHAGNYLGGSTGPGGKDGHTHSIVKGAATETTQGHNHRFSYVEGLLDAQATN
jgi:hypothetical protein